MVQRLFSGDRVSGGEGHVKPPKSYMDAAKRKLTNSMSSLLFVQRQRRRTRRSRIWARAS